jgi:hypothetical protein
MIIHNYLLSLKDGEDSTSRRSQFLNELEVEHEEVVEDMGLSCFNNLLDDDPIYREFLNGCFAPENNLGLETLNGTFLDFYYFDEIAYR